MRSVWKKKILEILEKYELKVSQTIFGSEVRMLLIFNDIEEVEKDWREIGESKRIDWSET